MIARITMIIFLVLSVRATAGELRTWTDRSGKLEVKAELVDYQPGRVWLRRDDERVFEIALSDLSEADQKYVDEQIRLREEAVQLDRSQDAKRIRYGLPRLLAELANQDIDESSGLARSTRQPGLLWTHNDSGDEPRLYLLDTKGHDLGYCELEGLLAYDWEDMASFEADGKHYLMACDTGNNGRAADVQMLHIVEEPKLESEKGFGQKKIVPGRTILYSYEDVPRDCEAVAIDPTDKTILLISKERGIQCYVYELPWPDDVPNRAFVAKKIGTLTLPPVTAMDISPDGRRAVVATYLNAYEYARGEKETWKEAFARAPRQIILPFRRQGESICYGPDGKTLYLTSEKLPTPLWEIPVEKP